MGSPLITRISTRDVRFKLRPGEGADAVHLDPVYSYAVTLIHTDQGLTGVGLAFTLGLGNDLVCQAIELLAPLLVGREIDEIMADYGRVFNQLANHHQLRWLGPHKGVIHLALASITNGCFDLWAKSHGVPLWKLLLDLTPDQVVSLIDFSYIEDVLLPGEALAILHSHTATRPEREPVIGQGYPGYDTSVGWFHYSDEQVRANVRKAVDAGFTAVKLKVGSKESERDIRRAYLVREAAGPQAKVMLDANQQWTLPESIRICLQLAPMSPHWIEEPTHPDDVLGHQTLARAIAPIPLALGEHVPNRVVFKNYLQAGAVGFLQADCVRVGGVSEFLAISLMARKFHVSVVPHVGDMGQIHQHLVIFNHIALGHEIVFLEHIPHLREHFLNPAQVEDGVYRTPTLPGSNSDLRLDESE